SQATKMAVPDNIKRLGVVTSPTGAAIKDILSVMKRRAPDIEVIIYPCLVQGQSAANEIAKAVHIANMRDECDLLIVGRGGGSMEDLWCFNDQYLAHTIFNSPLPIISAVGHEVDVTISDFVADYRAPTPSAAAEILSVSNEEQKQQCTMLARQLHHAITNNIHAQRQQLHELASRLKAQDPKFKLAQQAQYIDELNHQIITTMSTKLHNNEQRLAQLMQRLLQQSPQAKISAHAAHNQQLATRLNHAISQQLTTQQARYQGLMRELHSVSPIATLARGYSITLDKNKQVVTQASELSAGDTLVTKLHQGEVTSKITLISE
ncbi:MAG: exodeoxyribonuclease VII large subunit, partial [Psychrobium sp.]